MAVSLTVHIEAPAALVFEYVRDLDKVREWVQEVEEARMTFEPADRAVGTRFLQKIRQGFSLNEYQGEVIGFEQDRMLRVRLTGVSATMEIIYELEADSTGCVLTYESDLQSRNLRGAFLGLMFMGFSDSVLRRQLTTLKRIAEKAHQASL